MLTAEYIAFDHILGVSGYFGYVDGLPAHEFDRPAFSAPATSNSSTSMPTFAAAAR